MKKLLLLAPALFLLASCKKNYACTCNTQYSTTYGGNVNQAQYTTKQYNDQAANDWCTKKYNEDVKPTTSYSCTVI